MTPQATLTQFAPVDPVWRDLVLAQDGRDDLLTDDDRAVWKALRTARGERPTVPHLCRHAHYNIPLAYDLGLGPANFIGFCRLKVEDPSRTDLPMFCEAQFWPWYLCPHNAAPGGWSR